MNRHVVLVFFGLLSCLTTFASPAATVAQTRFQRDVAPLLVRRCLACHGERKHQGGYQLHTFEALLKPGESTAAPVAPGKPAESRLIELLLETDPESRMPKNAPPLSAAEIDLVRRWIGEGAKLEGAAPTAELVNIAQWKHPPAPEAYPRALPITALAFHPSGNELAVGGLHEITIWNVESGELSRRFGGVAERVYSLAYTRDGARLAAACGTPGQMGETLLLGAADGALERHFGSLSDCALAVAFSPDERRLAAAGADQRARVFDVASGEQQLVLKDHSDWVPAVAWSPDGARLATASRDKTCKVFDAASGALVTTFAEHGDAVYGVAFQDDGKHAMSCGGDKRLRYWLADDPGWEDPKKMDKKKRHQVGESSGFGGPVLGLALSGGLVFACSTDLGVRQFDIAKRSQTRAFAGHADWVQAVAFHPGAKRLAAGSATGEVRVWRIDAKDDKEPPIRVFLAAPGLAASDQDASSSPR